MQGYVYILESKNCSRFYVGSSKDPENRLDEHNSGETISLRGKGPLKVVFQKKYQTIEKARIIERKLKKFKSRKILERIVEEKEIKISA
ncbi:GIY-YIG nuclease family protein [Patescibacteria group bacterium]|nr:GIY-YIG nuclease family protein [Patescibacteria group bacterium]